MDKYEYKLRADEIKDLIANREYVQAMKVADTVDWRRVKSVMMLCTISDLYKINRRYEESRELLVMAYEKHPGGRMIIYSMCELSIKMGDFVHAIEAYKEFVQIAPKDTGRYILQYKLYEAQEVSLEERIEVLEEFKKRDYREKWAYELAYLYHRIGLSTKCVEECDELVLWFGEGKYVLKAMELKMLHEPLTASQQKKYHELKGLLPSEVTGETEQEHIEEEPVPEEAAPAEEMDIYVKPLKLGQYDTINIQKALAESMKELLSDEVPPEEDENAGEAETEMEMPDEEDLEENITEPDDPQEYYPEEEYAEKDMTEELEEETSEDVKDMIAPLFENTDELVQIATEILEEDEVSEKKAQKEEPKAEEIFFEENTADLMAEVVNNHMTIADVAAMPAVEPEEKLRPEIARMLSQEYDGQISLVVPEGERLEKQITGQMSIEDILAEWEKMKKENEQKRAEDVRKRVLEHTGSMFSEFDASTRSGILAQLDEAENVRRMQEEAETFPEEWQEEEFSEEELDDSEILAEELAEEETEELYEETESDEAYEELSEEEPSEEELPEVEELEEVEDIVLEETAELPDNIEQYLEVTMNEPDEAEEDSEGEVFQEDADKQKPTRALTEDEKDLYGSFIQTKREKNQIIQAVDTMSLAPYTGNVIITGDAGVEKVELAKNLIKEIQMSDANFSGKVAKISGKLLNKKDVAATISKMSNGALIIEKAGELTAETAQAINKVLEKGQGGIIVIMEDTAKAMDAMLENCPKIKTNFTSRIDVEALDNNALVAYGKRYALGLEYAIDQLGGLALYTRIADMQTSDHVVAAAEVREIVDEAIESASRKTAGHLIDLLFGKRYDDEDMIILKEKDFLE